MEAFHIESSQTGGNTWKIVTFSKSSIDFEIKKAISHLGYRVRTADGGEWINVSPEHQNEPTIILFDEEHIPKKKLITILDHSYGMPRVGVFAEDRKFFDSELAYLCDDFIEWPCGNGEFRARLERVLQLYHPSHGNSMNEIAEEFSKINMIGKSPVFVGILHAIKRYSRCDAAVLISGETGTGKELAARAIHYQSNRRDYPFIPVNCGAIPDNLIENELFGHEKGAFTDAGKAQKGVIEQATGGTLFLDEIDSLSCKAQVSLLRFLQDQEFRPLGSSRLRHANVRVVAATNTDLASKVAEGSFRADLFYRLNILILDLPALRHRSEDISLLANHFLEKFVNQYACGRKQFHPAAIAWMSRHDWPGNIRELENYVLREYLASDGSTIRGDRVADDAPRYNNASIFDNMDWDIKGGFSDAKAHVISEFEKSYIDWLLRKTGGNVSDAAKQSGKERRALGKLLKKYSIDKAKYYFC